MKEIFNKKNVHKLLSFSSFCSSYSIENEIFRYCSFLHNLMSDYTQLQLLLLYLSFQQNLSINVSRTYWKHKIMKFSVDVQRKRLSVENRKRLVNFLISELFNFPFEIKQQNRKSEEKSNIHWKQLRLKGNQKTRREIIKNS